MLQLGEQQHAKSKYFSWEPSSDAISPVMCWWSRRTSLAALTQAKTSPVAAAEDLICA